MAQGTLWFQPIQHVFSAAVVVPGAKAYFYTAGTLTPVNVYSDVGLTTAYTQPVTADSNGIFAEIFLTPGTAYKVDLQTSAGVSLTGYPADNQLAIPASASTVDSTETAGEAITAGQVVYLSDGSGGKNAGQVYKADSANTYSSTLPLIGLAPASITSGAQGTVRWAGLVGGLTVTIGTDYYVGTSGALTSTAPTNVRFVGRTDSSTSILVASNPPPPTAFSGTTLVSPIIKTSILTPSAAPLGHAVCGGRLTLTTATPVTSADVTGATTIYFSPYGAQAGNIGLYDGTTNWTILPFTEISLALGTLTGSLPYDVFVYNNSGTATLEFLAWSNVTTRATALVLQNGVLSKTGALTRRYLGTFYTDSTTQTSDAGAGSASSGRHLWNYYNRVPRSLTRKETTASWTYATSTIRQANASTANQVQLVQGVAESPLDLLLAVTAANSSNLVSSVGIGVDSTTTFDPGDWNAGANVSRLTARYNAIPAVGHHAYSWNEWSGGATSTFYGAFASAGGTVYGGLVGIWLA